MPVPTNVSKDETMETKDDSLNVKKETKLEPAPADVTADDFDDDMDII